MKKTAIGNGEREIKFRGKRLYSCINGIPDNSQWIYGFFMKNQHGESFIVESVHTDRELNPSNTRPTITCHRVDPESVGQCVFHKDKNGVEIYQGDIVSAMVMPKYPRDTMVTDIVWGPDFQWQVRSPGHSHGLPLTWGGWKSLEIIGNTSENLELLK